MIDYYPVLIRKEADSDFGVEFPDLPGCVTAGATIDEALRMAEEALRFHIDGMLEDGSDIPLPSSVAAVLERGEALGAAVCLVRLTLTKGRAVRVNITLDENLLQAVDLEAARSGTSRSGFLAEAARSELDARHDRRLDRAYAGTGNAFAAIKQVTAEEERVVARHPPDTSKLGRAYRGG